MMADQAHRRGVRKTSVKPNDSNKTNDDLEEGLLCPYQLIFLIESTLNNTKYIDVYKDAVEDLHNSQDQACNVVIIDYNRIVKSLDNSCVEQDEQYQLLHDRAKRYLNNNSKLSIKLMVLLVRQSIIINLKSMRQKWSFDSEPYTFQPAVVNIILTNFINLEFITDFIATKIKVDAIVKLSCGEIAETREKFVSREFRAKRSITDKVIQTFWQDFYNELNTTDGASVFKNVVVYDFKSKYNSNYEPPKVEKMLVMAKRYVMREMHKVHVFVYNLRIEYENYTRNDNPVYNLHVDDQDSTLQYYKSYTKFLKEYPEDAIGLPIILDAIIKVVIASPVQPNEQWVDSFFGALRNESNDGCMVYPVCLQYGNECGLATKKYNLRHTDYFDSTVNVLNVRWRKSLWGARPLPSLDTEAEHNHVIADVKRQCEGTGHNDVDVQLCVLALNRLRSNLDVYRGEPIDLPGLGQTNVKFKPELIEPAGCATMVQMLQKESENYKEMSHAYFEPEDVILVGFYDCQKVLQTRKSLFEFNVPQQPIYANDYFNLYYGKRTPNYFYAMDTVAAASDLTLTYTEEMEEIRFRDDDFLTITKRKWRFEPSTVSLVYKSKHYEIIKHVSDDDQHRGDEDDEDDYAKDDEDWLRVFNNNAGFEYYLDKSPKNVIRCIVRTTGAGSLGVCTVEMISANDAGYGIQQQSNRRRENNDGSKVNAAKVEVSRHYGNGRVVVEFTDRTKVTYWTSGKIKRPSRSSRSPAMESSKSNAGRPKSSNISDHSNHSGESVRTNIDTSKSVRVKKSQARKNNRSVVRMGKSPSRMKRKKSAISPSNISADTKNIEVQTRTRHHANYVEQFSEDGATRTVEFADGTSITGATNARQSSTVVPPYEYIHPAYRTVTEDRDGTFHVDGVCTMSRGLPGGPAGLRLTDQSVRIDATADAVYVYRLDSNDEDRLIATFGWNSSEFLFEKRINASRVVTVPRNRRLGEDLIWGTTGTATVTTEETASASECFVVKRGMSGFRTLDGPRYEQFADGVRGRRHTAVREGSRARIVTVYAADHDENLHVTADLPTSIRGSYEWLKPFSGVTAAAEDELVPATLQLVSRSLRKVDVDYGPITVALWQRNIALDTSTSADVQSSKLRVRVYVPDMDALRKIYAVQDPMNPKSSSRRDSTVAHDDKWAAKLACLRQEGRDAREAQLLMRHSRFIPFFCADNFEPLKRHLNAITPSICDILPKVDA